MKQKMGENKKIQLIIEVDEQLVCEGFERPFTEEERNILIRAIGNGTPLPKGHGDLIDRNALITELETDYHGTLTESGARLFVGITSYIDDAETIIEADKETDNK